MSRGPWLAAVLASALAAAGLAAAFAVPAEPSTPISDVHLIDITSWNHVPHPTYGGSLPPAGGDHAAEWLACGAYDVPVPNGNAVHSLEHGAVWISYDPELGEDDVALLRSKLPDEGIMAPYDDLPGPVVVTVWGRQLVLQGADDTGLDLFLRKYSDGHTAPEPFAGCIGGVGADGERGGAGVPV